MQAIQMQGRNPLWKDAYTGLTGLYFGSNAPEVPASFQRALGSPLIQDRLGKPVDRSRQLAGDIWFYYGQRYGEYLRDLGQSQASDEYLSSEVESRPGDPEAYLKLGRYYQQARQAERALTEFRHVLEVDTKRADIHSEIALVLWDAGRQNEALTEWKTGLGKFERQPDPTTGARIIRDIRSRQQERALRAEMDTAMIEGSGDVHPGAGPTRPTLPLAGLVDSTP